MQTDVKSSGQEQNDLQSLMAALSEKISQMTLPDQQPLSELWEQVKLGLAGRVVEEAPPPAPVNSEERFRALFEQMSEGFALHEMLFDENGTPVDYRFLEINPAFERLTGLKRADVIGRLKTEVLPGDTGYLMETYGRVAQTGESVRFDLFSLALQQHYEVFAYRPAPNQFATLFVNTTERKQIERDAHEGKRLLEAMLEFVPEGITIMDAASGQITRVSQYGQERLGMMAGNRPGDLIEHFDVRAADGVTPIQPEDLPLNRAVQCGETVRDYEMVVRDRNGERLTVLASSAPIRAESGEITGGILVWHDITQRRRQEEALRLSEERFRLASLSVVGVVYDWDLVTGHVVRSDGIDQLLGIAPGHDHPDPAWWMERIHPDDLAEHRGYLEQILAGAKDINQCEYRMRHNDGRWLLIQDRNTILRDERGVPVRLIGTNTDITAQRGAEEALRKSEERFRLASMAVSGIVYDWDIASDEVHRSGRLKDLLGYDPDDVPKTAQWWVSLIHPDDVEHVITTDREVDNQRLTQSSIVYRVRHKDGHYLTLEDKCFILRDENGKALRHVGSNTDVTEQRQAEEALRLSEERFRLASRAVQGIVYDWDVVNGKVYQSDGMAALVGYEPSEITGRDDWWFSRLHPDDRAQQQEMLARIFAEQADTYETEYRVQHRDGHWVHVLDRSFVVRDEDGQALRMIGSTTDITERKNYEKSLLAAQRREQARAEELETMMDAVPAFVWISHDRQSRYITGNSAAYQAVRMQPGENISKSAPDNQAPTHFVATKNGKEIPTEELPLQKAAATGKPVQDYEFDITFNTGEVVHTMGNAFPLFDENGEVRGAVSAFIDITERKRIEDALRESEAHFALTLANTSIFLFNQDRELRYTWSHNPHQLFEQSDTTGLTDEDFYCAEEAALLAELKRGVLRSGQSLRQELKLHIDGQQHIFDLILGPLKDERGEIVGLTGAATDITQMRTLEKQQLEHMTQLEVQRRLQEFRERERREIARDIHDGPIQTLMSALINIQLTKEVLENTALQLELEGISATVRSAVGELRDVVNQLRPPALIRFGLARSILIHAEDFREKHPECSVELDLPVEDIQMKEEVILSLFRIYQEALNNVSRHSLSRKVQVRYALEPEWIVMEIRDEGVGFEVPGDLLQQTQAGHYGLAGMRERAEAVGGELLVESRVGQGTTVRTVVPRK